MMSHSCNRANESLHWIGSSRSSLLQWGRRWRLLPASELGRWVSNGSMRLAFLLFAAGTLLTACRQAEVAQQGQGSPNPRGTFTGRAATSGDSSPMFFSPRTSAEVAADAEIVQHIVGAWVLDPRSDTDEYQSITIRADGTFTATNGSKQLSGAWRVDRSVLFLGKPNASTPLDYPGFHTIDSINDHQLVCGIGMSVAGRMRFTR
jgi:hypothetical protein